MKTVLILEDESRLSSAWQSALEEVGFRVFVESTSEDAVATLAAEQVDVVVVDMLIRDHESGIRPKGGLSFLTHVHLNVENSPKVIAVTGSSPDLKLLSYAQLLKADLRLEKPFAPEELTWRVQRLCEHDKD